MVTGGGAVQVFKNLDELVGAKGAELGPTEWLEIGQDRVNKFAEATEDHQWIHVDPERAADGPFGGTIAHGLLTLSLLPYFSHHLYRVEGISLAVNYGYNKVRFITPVKVGAKVRARAVVTDVTALEGAAQSTVNGRTRHATHPRRSVCPSVSATRRWRSSSIGSRWRCSMARTRSVLVPKW